MPPLRTRLVGLAAAVLATGALCACGGGGGKAASVHTPAGQPAPAPSSGGAPGNAPASAPPITAVQPANGGGPAPTGSATPGGQDDTQAVNQIDNELSNIDGSLSTSDSVSAQETS